MTGPQLLEGVAGKEGVTFFRGVQFSHKNKLNSEIFNDKKSLAKIFFCVITKNSNWGILDKMVLTMKNFNIFGVH